MQENYHDLINKLRNKKIVFYGIGRSNLPFIKMLTDEDIPVTVYDEKAKECIDHNILEDLSNNKNIFLKLADKSIWNEHIDVIIRSPGVNFLSENILKAKKNGALITSEMEIFFDICPCKIIGVTGSDGKTTVTTLISEILKSGNKKVYVGGNIGKPLLPEIKNIKKEDFAVVELSSFQLISMRKSPDIAIVTNISPNHLDVHKDMHEYIHAKEQIILHQNAFSTSVLNYDNSITNTMSDKARGEILFFSTKEKIQQGTWIDENKNIIFSKFGKDKKIINLSDIKIPGMHNVENYMAAICAVESLVSGENIKDVANSFSGVEHRIEFVKSINGISFYNDSIASSPTRVIKGALSLFDGRVILIAGGHDKKVPFTELAEKINEKVSTLILMGPAASKIESDVINSKNYDSKKLSIIHADCMKEAVKSAWKSAKSGDTILLSPACTSFDSYKNFEERGRDFKKIVNNL
ncbi:MAG: UDP-N-acetylmuramoyl-L-alanine--D-glutamate ligase [Acutalibacteraceae bacterium]